MSLFTSTTFDLMISIANSFRKEVDRLAWILRERGVKSGDFVAVFMTNSPEMVFTIFAVAKLGAVAGLINATLRRECLI